MPLSSISRWRKRWITGVTNALLRVAIYYWLLWYRLRLASLNKLLNENDAPAAAG